MSHCDVCNVEGNFSFSIQVHSIPRKGKIRKQWIHAVQGAIEGWTPKEDSVLCSKHFEESCYQDPDPALGKTGKVCRRLKDTAVPTIFKTATNRDLVRNDTVNGKLSSSEMDEHVTEDEQLNGGNRDEGTAICTRNKGKEEAQSKLSSHNHQPANGEIDVDVVTVSADGVTVTFSAYDSYEEQTERENRMPASKQESNAVFFDGDLNLPLRKVFEQMTKIKEEQRAKKATVDQSQRDGDDSRWCGVAQDFRAKLETYTQQFDRSQTHIPVTFDPSAPGMISVLGDSQETLRLKENLTVPCLGKIYTSVRTRAVCPLCGVVLGDMRRVLGHICQAKRKAIDNGRKLVLPDVALLPELRWKRYPLCARKSKKIKVTGLNLDNLKDSDEETRKKKRKKRQVSMWRRLNLKQTSLAPRELEELTPIKKKKKKKKKRLKKKKRKTKEKDKNELEKQFDGVNTEGESGVRSVAEQSLTERIAEMKEMEKSTVLNELTYGTAADLLFSDLEAHGFVQTQRIKKEPVDLGYPLQSGMDQSQDLPMADTVNIPQVYPISIIPSNLLLTNMNPDPPPEVNDSANLDNKSLVRAQLGLPPLTAPVKLENSSTDECPRLNAPCSSEEELGAHLRQDTTSSVNACGAEGDGGGRARGITLGDGTFVKAEPMDYDDYR